eukprot:1333940-Amorphochlora_amoeboformis.AAC.1
MYQSGNFEKANRYPKLRKHRPSSSLTPPNLNSSPKPTLTLTLYPLEREFLVVLPGEVVHHAADFVTLGAVPWCAYICAFGGLSSGVESTGVGGEGQGLIRERELQTCSYPVAARWVRCSACLEWRCKDGLRVRARPSLEVIRGWVRVTGDLFSLSHPADASDAYPIPALTFNP